MYSLAEQLERRIARLSQQLRASAPRGRSVGALLALRRLEDEGPQRVSDLAAAELVAQPTMTVLVNRLVEEGLVRKTPHATDARAVLVAITDAGRTELARVRAARAAVLDARLAGLDADERAALEAALPALDRLIAS
jgi:DNA-binding MarR family transcriptional regulator